MQKLTHALIKQTPVIVVLACLIMLVGSANADHYVDFEGYPDRTPVSDLHYPGISFSGLYIVLTQLTHLHDGAFIAPAAGGDALTIEFDEPQAAFSIDVEGTGPFVQAYLNGQLVREKLYPIGPYNDNPVGMSNLIFDKLVISEPRLDGSYALDDLRTVSAPSVPSGDPKPPDNRLNWHYGDATIAILYPGGNAVDVYDYATGSYIFNFITADDVPDMPPDQSTIIRQQGNIMVSILTTGEIQFNLGPDAEGKSYVFIMGDIYGSNRYGFKYDPSE
ncbi:MAG: hypothetical protein KC615_09195 [Anaerolineae bacterium]|nr:hypothetical protein [Anaerolineae bacterium]